MREEEMDIQKPCVRCGPIPVSTTVGVEKAEFDVQGHQATLTPYP